MVVFAATPRPREMIAMAKRPGLRMRERSA
jgi:hypothetical protein